MTPAVASLNPAVVDPRGTLPSSAVSALRYLHTFRWSRPGPRNKGWIVGDHKVSATAVQALERHDLVTVGFKNGRRFLQLTYGGRTAAETLWPARKPDVGALPLRS